MSKLTAEKWSSLLGLKFTNIAPSWPSEKEFKTLKLTREEFLNLAARCEIEKPQNLSRRDAARLAKQLLK